MIKKILNILYSILGIALPIVLVILIFKLPVELSAYEGGLPVINSVPLFEAIKGHTWEFVLFIATGASLLTASLINILPFKGKLVSVFTKVLMLIMIIGVVTMFIVLFKEAYPEEVKPLPSIPELPTVAALFR